MFTCMYIGVCVCDMNSLMGVTHPVQKSTRATQKRHIRKKACMSYKDIYVYTCMYICIYLIHEGRKRHIRKKAYMSYKHIYLYTYMYMHPTHPRGQFKKEPFKYSGIVFRLFAFFILLVCYGGFGVALYVSVYVCLILIVGYSS